MGVPDFSNMPTRRYCQAVRQQSDLFSTLHLPIYTRVSYCGQYPPIPSTTQFESKTSQRKVDADTAELMTPFIRFFYWNPG